MKSHKYVSMVITFVVLLQCYSNSKRIRFDPRLDPRISKFVAKRVANGTSNRTIAVNTEAPETTSQQLAIIKSAIFKQVIRTNL